jgi:hypothetical protein
MKALFQAFTKHPGSVGETYLQHMAASLSFASAMLLAGMAALIHGAFPFLCVKTGSCIVARLHDRMVVHRVPPGRVDREAIRRTDRD